MKNTAALTGLFAITCLAAAGAAFADGTFHVSGCGRTAEAAKDLVYSRAQGKCHSPHAQEVATPVEGSWQVRNTYTDVGFCAEADFVCTYTE